MSAQRLRVLLIVVLSATIATGCGSAPPGPSVAPVEGTIKFEGKALENAAVVFLPTEPNLQPASGVTDKDGHYRLTTTAPNDGAIVGKHRVTVTARGPDKTLPEDQNLTGLPGGNIVPGDPIIPEKYFLPDSSGLTAEVKAGKSSLDFDLKE